MRVLFTGERRNGSYQIRGEQIAAALGMRAKLMATTEDCARADAVVVVKRTPPTLVQNIRQACRPWVLDLVDAYPQPKCSTWSRETSIGWIRGQLESLAPDMVIWPNERMRADCGGAGPVLYHHARPGMHLNPIRDRIEAIGYEGSAQFLSDWREPIEAECRRRGIRFMVNPQHLADVDVVLAVRGIGFGGYAQRNWKSQVKLANAHGSGTPFIGQEECGYLETASGAERWISEPGQLGAILDALEPREERLRISRQFLRHARPVHEAAADLMSYLCALKS